ncbi:hypothetical protein DVR12_03680 [Chitinophaga silvatica]|uniref:Uncharacterized protein n=1 Tax=Chitinophaga silvatica TaxID=2282649 RepID=A0A3E1YHQ1_9BACT|nr:hypothetical protein [Chitinophaga silvatica]RFS26896.1 hypothetical protein DVR12_03680 [Chitinophaga silvatica]
MLRTIIFTTLLLSALAVKAQLPSFSEVNRWSENKPEQKTNDSNYHKKWFVVKSASLSTGFMASNVGSGSFLSVPLGVQINRQLTNNLIAFGGLSATPYIMQLNGVYYPAAQYKNNGMMRINNSGILPSARAGIMYISNDRTFSVSGSVSVSRGSYFGNFPGYSPINPFMQY